MKITWLGHACFVIESNSGKKLLTDPFDTSVGYSLPQVEADVVTVSHDHYDHNAVNILPGAPQVVKSTQEQQVAGFKIRGVPSFHDDADGGLRGDNVIFIIEVDGLTLCHVGDLGHLLSDKLAAEVGHPDILLVPVGGTYTITGEHAFEVMKQIKAQVTIPMHYKTEALSFDLATVDDFLGYVKNYDSLGSNTVTIDQDNIADLASVLVLSPPSQ